MRAGLALAATTLVASPGGQGGRSGPDWSGRNRRNRIMVQELA